MRARTKATPRRVASPRIASALSGPPRRAGSGPATARLFDRLLALIFGIAWLSLGAQIDVLMGSRGLLPVEALARAADAQRVTFSDLPTIFRASFAVAGRTFLSFQWDNLLLECGLVATLLPRDRPARWAHVIARILLFKLYWESGLAKWQSHLHDWRDGSAMTLYYETAPLPTRLAHAAHALPVWWHHAESALTLIIELILPLAIFAPRRPRLVAAAVLTAFQLVNIATANYGFFAYLAIALHVFLLDEGDVTALRERIERRAPSIHGLRAILRLWRARARRAIPLPSIPRGPARAIGIFAVIAYASASIVQGLMHFSGSPDLAADLAPIEAIYGRYRIVSTYHLFAAITRERVEPTIEISDGGGFEAHDLRYKPGDPARAPGFVAPHQPRVDFQLWFYGLSYQRGTPPYVTALLDRACHDPAAIQGLFADPLPARPAAVRVAFWRYDFTTPDERRATGAWWKRAFIGSSPAKPCR